MGRWLVLGGACGLVLGCRQPNPDWLGPSSDSSVFATTDVMTTDATTTDVVTSGATAADASAGGTGVGPMCQGDGDCAEPTPVCVDGTCMSGVGLPCNNDGGCPDSAPFCNPNDECQVGNEGDPCSQNGQSDCSGAAPICGPDDQCHDGSPGDPCDKASQCVSGTCTADACE